MNDVSADGSSLPENELAQLARGIVYIWQNATRDVVTADRLKGLQLQQFLVMRAVRDRPLRMSDLAQLTDTSSANVTGLVSRLVDRGLVTREHDTKDRRVVHVALTPLGRTEIAAQAKQFRSRVEALMAPLDAEEQREFVRLVDKICCQIDDEFTRATREVT